jgi:predicted phosphohydrolase
MTQDPPYTSSMLLAVTADLHWGLSREGDAATRALAAQVEALGPDLFAIAGDVGEGAEWEACLAELGGLPCGRAVIPGNHDLWSRDPALSSLRLYEELLPMWAGEAGFHYLDGGPVVLPESGLAVMGSINWYDYSFADPAVAEVVPHAPELYRAKQFLRGRHNDGRFVRLGMSDEEFTARVVERFRSQLAALPPEIERIVVIQHHPPVRELFYPTPLTEIDQKIWLAYTGNRRMQDLVLSDPRIVIVLCGHTHAYCEAEVAGKRCINLGGDYDYKRLMLLDTETGERRWWEFRAE